MKKIIENLRNEIKELASAQKVDKDDTRRQIRELTWKPGSEAIVAALRAERDENGHRKHGKKAIKAYRRPETGPERCRLHMYLNNAESDNIRAKLLIYGLLRGRAYHSIEAKTRTPWSAWVVLNYLKPLFPAGQCPYAEKDIKEWLSGERTSLREVV